MNVTLTFLTHYEDLAPENDAIDVSWMVHPWPISIYGHIRYIHQFLISRLKNFYVGIVGYRFPAHLGYKNIYHMFHICKFPRWNTFNIYKSNLFSVACKIQFKFMRSISWIYQFFMSGYSSKLHHLSLHWFYFYLANIREFQLDQIITKGDAILSLNNS